MRTGMAALSSQLWLTLSQLLPWCPHLLHPMHAHANACKELHV